MNRTLSRKRPWLAALLAVLATGLGHLYLRRWRRAVGWLAALLAVSYLFVDPAAAVTAISAGGDVDLVALVPSIAVGSLSALDAYLLAHAQNALARVAITPDGELAQCPNCRKEVDPDLDFCHWCTTELPAVESASTASGDADAERGDP